MVGSRELRYRCAHAAGVRSVESAKETETNELALAGVDHDQDFDSLARQLPAPQSRTALRSSASSSGVHCSFSRAIPKLGR